MFSRHDITLISDPVCRTAIKDLSLEDFRYYDKDGFELNLAEQKFYIANKFPVISCLNHLCWQEPWFELERSDLGLILDHCMFLCRASYASEAYNQLSFMKPIIATADLLLRTKQKWGFDFALDAVSDNGTVYEVLHVEYDNHSYDFFREQMQKFDFKVRHTDWQDAAKRIWENRDQWQHLKGFDQNHWKAEYLLGWTKAEYTEKTV